jgi:zinc transport system ATP-binding protein
MQQENSQILASLKNTSLKLNDQQILKDINLELKQGEITTLIGPNGGGKTSIARILLQILHPSSGKVFIKKNIKIGYVPQKLEIEKTIPLRVIDFLGLDIKIPEMTMIKKIGIENILEKSIHQISGGQMQKTLLARALINNPEILVLDEPTSNMDISAQAEFYDLIEEIRKKQHCAILLISHDLHIVMQKTNQVICINHHICCSGSPESINEHPEYLLLFGKNKASNIAIYPHNHNHKH